MSTHSEQEKKSIAMSSVLAGAFLTVAKLVVGLLTGSLGILSEAAHSALDLVAAYVTLLAVRVSDKPADEDHRYGHGKVENLSALIETVLLLITCGWIVKEAIKRLFFREIHVEPTLWAFAVMVISIIIDFSRSRALNRVAIKYDSQALAADALHFSTDIWSSLVVLVGLAAVKVGQMNPSLAGLDRADAMAALMVALIVVLVSLRLGRKAVDFLLDRAPPGIAAKVERAALTVDGVIACHKVRVRASGNQTFVDLHVDVDRNLPFEKSHAISEIVERAVESVIPNANALVHIDPVEHREEPIADRIRSIALNQNMTVHNIQVHREKKGVLVDMHLEVDDRMNLQRAHTLASRLEKKVRQDQPSIASITTHIESRRNSVEPTEDMTHHMEALVSTIKQIANEAAGFPECHNIQIRRVESQGTPDAAQSQDKLIVSLHCRFDKSLPIGEVHRRSDDIQQKVMEAMTEVERVSVHAEPK